MSNSNSSSDSGRALIIVVDPDPHVKRLERYFLESAGFDVEVVSDGVEGLERARAVRPVIVIADLLLPRKDGLSVCREIKSNPETRGIRVVVLSVLAAEERARQAGADAFLRKPIDDARLIATVQALLAKRDAGG